MSCALDAVSVSRNTHLKLFKLSSYRKIWIKIQLTSMAPTPSNYTGYQSRGQGKLFACLAQMELGSRLLLRFWLGRILHVEDNLKVPSQLGCLYHVLACSTY
ncbi:uncharacterized protein LOC131303711 [Rhododendron vialii]|uniref:uncharacterized protein LOC131303711 n=1 Tax=Rhododendron vialii TaxID=182163 RepID=UPI00265EC834|nr:uncharacterized protein LOC131303711 [Rhododendron vialii]XP_058186697.1 uncharacterized protein LOC131303711 [Rhododendron vialii]XP_058186698.1 uncharacterized protein LOC131303711 [Rhododendron vialii]